MRKKEVLIAKTNGEYAEQCVKFEKLFSSIQKAQKLIMELNNVPKKDVPNNMIEEFMTERSYDLYCKLEDAWEDTVTVMRMDFEINGL